MLKLVPQSRRFWKDKHHAYGWGVGFDQTVIDSVSGQIVRVSFRDIGTDRQTAISNALRNVESRFRAYAR